MGAGRWKWAVVALAMMSLAMVAVVRPCWAQGTTEAPLSGPVILAVGPVWKRAQVGDLFTVQVIAQAGSQLVDAAHVYLDFDPRHLQVVDAWGEPVGGVNVGGSLDQVLLNEVDGALGQINLAVQSELGQAANGEFVVASMTMRAVAPTSRTALTLVQSGPRFTDVWYENESVLGWLVNAHVEIVAPVPVMLPVHLPLVVRG